MTTTLLAVLLLGAGAARPAATLDELRAALRSAKPGDTVVLKDGRWAEAEIELSAAGTDARPITLRAETPGGAVLTGSSRLTFAAPFVVVEGLLFKGGALDGGAVVRFASHHGRLRESAVVDYNPASEATGYPWVVFEGDDNTLERSFFKGKNNRRPLLTNRPGARRNRVLGCHFKDVAWRDENGREIVQIMGYGMNEETGDDGAFFALEGNLFESAHGEGMEIVSIKSNRNQVRFNTFLRSKGGITNRSGNFNVIEGNVILGEGEPRSYGIRVTGQQQRVAHNYVADVDGAGLLLVAGEYYQRALTDAFQPLLRDGTPFGRVPRYAQVRRGSFEHNTLVNCAGGGIEIGSAYKAGWPESQRVLIPEDNRFVGNLVVQPRQRRTLLAAEPDPHPPLDVFRFWPNVFEANTVVGMPPNGVQSPGILTIGLPLPERPTSASPLVERDDSAAARRPLRPEQVGPSWLKER